jgi:hypothetical protein
MYRYPQFAEGTAYFKNGNVNEAKFNYNYLNNRILFISPRGDTLELAHGEEFDRIVIQSDTFRYYEKEFIQQVTHDSLYNLYVKNSLRYNGRERKAAYGGYSGTAASSSLSHIYPGVGAGVISLSADENIKYGFRVYYYLSGKFGRFYPATKKGFYDLFPKYQREIKSFVEEKEIDFGKKEDVEKLLQFVKGLLR